MEFEEDVELENKKDAEKVEVTLVVEEEDDDEVVIEFEDEGLMKFKSSWRMIFFHPVPDSTIPIFVVTLVLFLVIAAAVICLFFPATIAGVHVTNWALWIAVAICVFGVFHFLVHFIWRKLEKRLPSSMFYYIVHVPGSLVSLVWAITVWPLASLYVSDVEAHPDVYIYITRLFASVTVVAFFRIIEVIVVRFVVARLQRDRTWLMVLESAKQRQWLSRMLHTSDWKKKKLSKGVREDESLQEDSKAVTNPAPREMSMFSKKVMACAPVGEEERDVDKIIEDLLPTMQMKSVNEVTVAKVADLVLLRLPKRKRDNWKLKDVMQRFNTNTIAVECFSFFEKFAEEKGRINLEATVQAVREIFQTHVEAAKSLRDREILADTLASGVGVVFWLLMVFLVLVIFGVPSDLVLSLVAALLGFAFIFGSSLMRMWHSLLLIFVVVPFNNGDWIEVEGDLFIVDKITLFVTEVRTVTGKRIYLDNAKLFETSITNLNRKTESKCTLDLFIEVDGRTSKSRLKKFDEQLREWLKEDVTAWDWENFSVYTQMSNNMLELELWLPIFNIVWQDAKVRHRSRTEVLWKAEELLTANGILATKPIQTIFTTKAHTYDDLIDFGVTEDKKNK